MLFLFYGFTNSNGQSSNKTIDTVNVFLNERASTKILRPQITLQEGVSDIIYTCKHPTVDVVATTDGKKVAIWDLNTNKLIRKYNLIVDDNLIITNLQFSAGNVLSVKVGREKTLFGGTKFTKDDKIISVQVNRYGVSDTLPPPANFNLATDYDIGGMTEAAVNSHTILVNYSNNAIISLYDCVQLWFNPMSPTEYCLLDSSGVLRNQDQKHLSTITKKRDYLTTLTYWPKGDPLILGFSNGHVSVINRTSFNVMSNDIISGLNRITGIYCEPNRSLFLCVGEDTENIIAININNYRTLDPIIIPPQKTVLNDYGAWDEPFYFSDKFPKRDITKEKTWFTHCWDKTVGVLAVVYKKNRIMFLNFKSGKFNYKTLSHISHITAIQIIDNGRRCLVIGQTPSKESENIFFEKKYVIDLEVNEDHVKLKPNVILLKEVTPTVTGKVWFSANGTKLFLHNYYELSSWNLTNLNQEKSYNALYEWPRNFSQVYVCPGKNWAVVSSYSRALTMNYETHRKKDLNLSFLISEKSPQKLLTIDNDHDLIYTEVPRELSLKKENELSVWNSDGKRIRQFITGIGCEEFNNSIGFNFSNDGKWIGFMNAVKGEIEVYSTTNWKKVISLKVAEKFDREAELNYDGGIEFSEDGQYVAIYINGIDGGVKPNYKITKDGLEWNADNRNKHNWQKIHFWKLDNNLVTATRQNSFPYKGKIEAICINPIDYSVAITNVIRRNRNILKLNKVGETEHSFKGDTNPIKSLAFSPNGKLLAVSSFFDIKLFNLQKKEESLSILRYLGSSSIDHDLFVTPEGYYFGDNIALSGLSFAYNGRAYPVEQFDLILNRPDLVISKLENHDTTLVAGLKMAFIKRNEKLGFDSPFESGKQRLPTISLLKNVPNSSSSDSIRVFLRLDAHQNKLKILNVFVNHVPVFGRYGMAIPSITSLDTSILIPITSNTNIIEISVTNDQTLESIKLPIDVKKPPAENKPNLYYIGIGLSKVKNPLNNLLYVDNDVKDFINVLKGKTDRFAHVYDTVLINNQVSKESIMGLKQWLLQSKIEDRVIVYYSGHGYLLGNNDYYLGTYDIDYKSPSLKGLGISQFNDLLDAIPALNKLAIINACRSGEADDGYTYNLMRSYFMDLRRGNGASIITAAGNSKQFTMTAAEGEDWEYGRNSLFGYMVLKCMKENKKGGIKLLSHYLTKEIPKQTIGMQQPTLKSINRKTSFWIW
jgi:WD40 repeat protein